MATTTKKSKVEQEMMETFGLVPKWVSLMPESAIEGFWATMRDFQLAETAIPNKYKELIGLAVSGATRCRYCQLFHVETARLFGATEDEIHEAAMMSAHTMAASTFMNTEGVNFDDFKKETLQIVANIKAKMAEEQNAPQKKGEKAPARV
jgi:AhpD family alkylhydroperoxidase